MVTYLSRLGIALALLLAPVWAQGAPDKDGKQAAAESDGTGEATPVVAGEPPKEEVKVLRPQDVAAELLRLKSKADIKAEITVLPLHGRKVVVKGVVRNGKLIERFQGRRFIAQKNIDHNQSGVRLWWVNNTAGWIFLRYSQVQSIALVGTLTAEERRKIMDALKAGKKPDEKVKATEAKEIEQALQKMSRDELERYLLVNYPADKGWNHTKLRELKRKQIIENQTLAREDAIFVRYFSHLIKARLKELKRSTKKVEFEPGTGEKSDGEESPDGDTGSDSEEGSE